MITFASCPFCGQPQPAHTLGLKLDGRTAWFDPASQCKRCGAPTRLLEQAELAARACCPPACSTNVAD